MSNSSKNGYAQLDLSGQILAIPTFHTKMPPSIPKQFKFSFGDVVDFESGKETLTGIVVAHGDDPGTVEVEVVSPDGYYTAVYWIKEADARLTTIKTETPTTLNPEFCYHRWEKIQLFTSTIEHCKTCGISKKESENLEIRKKEEKSDNNISNNTEKGNTALKF